MKTLKLLIISALILGYGTLSAQTETEKVTHYLLTSAEDVQLTHLKADPVTYKGKEAIRLTNDSETNPEYNQETLAILSKTNFTNGTIEIELAGLPVSGSVEGSRGFIGIAFRVDKDDHSRYECFYLRPTNGRAGDQLRRNHTTQYISHPDFTWYRLRQETPGMYESYVDLVPGDWTRVKIEVEGTKARLFVHGAEQPCLIVNDLKKGETVGYVALWIHATTEGYFRNLTISFESIPE